MLDEAPKKFITWSSNRHLQLAERLLEGQQLLELDRDDMLGEIGRPGHLGLNGPAYDQIKNLKEWVGRNRYNDLAKTYIDISEYMEQVKVEEQPFHKVADFVRHAKRHHKTEGAFVYDEDVIQLRGYILAISLLLKCNVTLMSDFMNLWEHASMARTEINVYFSANLAQCEEIIRLAASTSRPQLQVEGHTYYAQFCGFANSLSAPRQPSTAVPGAFSEPDDGLRECMQNKGFQHLEHARSLLESANWDAKYLMQAEIEAATLMLHGGVFYRAVMTDELRAVYAAMAQEFHGTGHWYTCERGHPFTVGECGMPMEEARCPECGSPVGGQQHRPAEGVVRADEIEEFAAEMGDVENEWI